jgi:hypothetical protein
MRRDEFERNKRRFGDDVDAWPAPFRQQALAFMAGATDRSPQDDPDRALDRLVLDAVLMDSDEQALARKVLARIDVGRARPSFLPDSELLALASGARLSDDGLSGDGIAADPAAGEDSL